MVGVPLLVGMGFARVDRVDRATKFGGRLLIVTSATAIIQATSFFDWRAPKALTTPGLTKKKWHGVGYSRIQMESKLIK
jgi:hypothetical protein